MIEWVPYKLIDIKILHACEIIFFNEGKLMNMHATRDFGKYFDMS